VGSVTVWDRIYASLWLGHSSYCRRVPDVLLRTSIRRAILDALADELTIMEATEVVAVGWATRRITRGDSPAAVGHASALVYSVGAEIALDFHESRSAA
jgi:hypothetical protein